MSLRIGKEVQAVLRSGRLGQQVWLRGGADSGLASGLVGICRLGRFPGYVAVAVKPSAKIYQPASVRAERAVWVPLAPVHRHVAVRARCELLGSRLVRHPSPSG